MAKKPKMLVALEGKSTDSNDIRDFAFHSDYPMFKIHEIESDSISISAGSSSGSVTISHNLGYVPAFAVYQEGYGWELFPNGVDSYATTTGITITKTLDDPYNQVTYDYNDWLSYYLGSLPEAGVVTGQLLGSNYDSFVRFVNVAIAQGQTITSATFEFTKVRTTSTADIKFRTYGIDEDNTADFGGDPSGRSLTTAYNQKTQSANTNYFNFSDDWTDQAQEIVDREGWSTGNAMGFKFQQDGTDNGHVMYFDRESNPKNYNLSLKIVLPGSLTTNYKVVIFKDKIA